MSDLIYIENTLKKIFKDRLNIDIKSDNYEDNLLGNTIGISASELIYIFFDTEEKFNIKIKEEYIVNEEFSSFKGIVNIIRKSLMEKQNLENEI